jgi:hypothetical protein
MMKYPKGIDRYRLQNQMVKLYHPEMNYAVLEIYNRNPHFLYGVSPISQAELRDEEEENK